MVALGNYFFHYRTTLSPALPLLLLLPGPIILPDPFAAALIGLTVALAAKSYARLRSGSSTSCAAVEIAGFTPTTS